MGHFMFRVLRRRLFKEFLWKLSQVRERSTNVIYDLMQRGVVKEVFPKHSTPIISSGIPCAYAGFDATSDSLHVGNLLILVALLHWQRAGNQVIVVIGDSTAEIGDPSGHNTDRDVLVSDIVKNNASSIEESINRIFGNHYSFVCDETDQKKNLVPVKILRNSSWYNQMNVADFMSKVGRHIRVGDMLSRTSVKLRMNSGEGINFSEFSYQLFQAYDWLHLYDKYGCQFQFGGGDQRGNIVTGYQLLSDLQTKNVYGALLPLIHSESGDKYGKSSGNAVYINEDRACAFNLYQFFMRIHDTEVENYLRLFTFLSEDEIQRVVINHKENPDSHLGQKKIAENVVLLVHGEKGLNKAKRATKAFYSSDIKSLLEMDLQELKQIISPSFFMEVVFQQGLSLLDLTLMAKCFLNEKDANRIICEGGVYVNFQKVKSPDIVITPGIHILPNSSTLLRIGKKTYYLVVWK